MWAAQAEIFNRYVMARISDGLLGKALIGDRLVTARGEEFIVDDVAHAQKRIDSWESQILGPLFGDGMKPVTGAAAEREAAVITALNLDPRAVSRLHGDRRAIRVQPTKSLCDIEGKDLVICCDLPVDAYLGVVMEEIVKETVKVQPPPPDEPVINSSTEPSVPRDKMVKKFGRLTVRKSDRPTQDPG